MIVRLNMVPEMILECFDWLKPTMIEAYRDATYTTSDFDLSLTDCWRGLVKGMEQGWLKLPSSLSDFRWGEIDIDEYEHYDNPLNGDMHEVVPGKLIAFKGPRDLGSHWHRDDASGGRDFSADHYADVFEDFEVAAVVRLCEPRYDGRRFEERGMGLHELEFEDCSART